MERTTTLAKPVKVSGFIKAVRWGLLVYGIVHGNLQWHKYHTIQTEIREERQKIYPAIRERERVAKLQMLTNQIKEITELLNIELPPDWTAEGL